jgi:phage tail P2-like protein
LADSLLPPSRTRLERDVEQTTARLERATAPFQHLWNAWECPLHLLPWLAWALGVDEWSNSWPENRKRQVVATALQVRRRAGTRGAVRTAVEALDIEGIEYSEWYQYGGEPYSYRISATLEERGMSQEEYEQLVRVIRRAGRLSAWLDPVGFTVVGRGRPRMAAAAMGGHDVTLLPLRRALREQSVLPRIATAIRSALVLAVLPPVAFVLADSLTTRAALTVQIVTRATVYPMENE